MINVKFPHELFKDGFLVLDLETTGFPAPDVGIVEIAIMSHEGEILVNTLINPRRLIPPRASKIHGIYDADVVNAKTFDEIYPELVTLLSSRYVVAYNASFEQGIFKFVCGRMGLPNFPNVTWYCAMRAYSSHRRRQRFFKLTKACVDEGIPIINAHRALGDCMMTLRLMHKMASRGD